MALWTPANTTTVLWYDADNAGSITSSSGLVTQWNDLSGNANHVTASGSARPTLTSFAINGKSAITFTPPSNVMTLTNSVSVTQNMTAFLIANRATGTIYSFGIGFGSAAYPFTMMWATSGYVFTAFGTNSGTTINPSANTTTGTKLIATQRNHSTSKERGWINGGYVGQGAISNLYGSEVFNRLGGRNGSGTHNGHMGEFILVGSALSDVDREKFEGYLAHKWGITLSGGHTYYSGPPTLPDTIPPMARPIRSDFSSVSVAIGR